jgi:hypothetical protein
MAERCVLKQRTSFKLLVKLEDIIEIYKMLHSKFMDCKQ